MNRWVCITKNFSNFTYGKIYEGELIGNSLLDIENDLGEKCLPALYGVEPREITRENRRYYGIPTKKIYYFISLDKWRQQQIEKIL